MPITGISGSDLKHASWNFTVATGVALTCGWVARRVCTYAHKRAHYYLKPKPQSTEAKRAWNIAQWTGVAAGVGVASLVHWKISGSRFGLIHNPSLDKMLKLGAGQAALGLALDLWIKTGRPFFTGFGAAVAAAGLWSRYSLIGIGAIGALVGVGKI
jgi:hypothetical protein